MVSDCHFQILGVTRFSSRNEIKRAYRQLIKKWHPDKFHGEPKKISEAIEISKQINAAFELLKDYLPPGTKEAIQKQKFGDSKSASGRTGTPEFHRVKVNSDKIWAIGYDAFTGILQVEFYESGTYHYYDVPETLYTQLRFADSVDDYLSKNITWKYRWEKV